MSPHRFLGANIFAAAVLASPAAQAEQPAFVSYSSDGIAQCEASRQAQAEGKLPAVTDFAKQFWSRMQCGRQDEAMALANASRQTPALVELATNDKAEILAKCFGKSFPEGVSPRVVDLPTGRTIVFGEHVFNNEDARKLFGASMAACKAKLDVK